MVSGQPQADGTIKFDGLSADETMKVLSFPTNLAHKWVMGGELQRARGLRRKFEAMPSDQKFNLTINDKARRIDIEPRA